MRVLLISANTEQIYMTWKVEEKLLEKMVRAGCIEVAFGFEK